MTTVPEALRQAIKLAGMTQRTLARETGLSTKHINFLFMGKAAMSIDVALQFERILPTLSAEDLMVAQTRAQVHAARLARFDQGTE